MMQNRVLSVLAILSLSAALVACPGGSTAGGGVAGNWDGKEDYPTGYSDAFTRYQLTNTGNAIGGTVSYCDQAFAACTPAGNVTGSLNGNNAQWTYTDSGGGTTTVAGTFNGSAFSGTAKAVFQDKTTQTAQLTMTKK